MSSFPPHDTSQAQPLPNRVVAAALNFSLNPSKEPNAPSMAEATSPDGVPPPFGPMIVQKMEWLQWPPPWFLTAPFLSSGIDEKLLRISSTGFSSHSVPLIASFSLST